MCRGWKGLALVAACWCLNWPALAQEGTYPSPVGAARMPEPIPCTPSATPPPPQPNLVPGPISSQAAPMGPPDSLSLPYDHSSAFQCENYVQDTGVYVHVGPMALQRYHLGAGDIGVFNTAAQGYPTVPGQADPFLPTAAGTSSALNFNSINPSLSLGIRGTVGYLWGNQAIEFTDFYIFRNDVSASASRPNGIDTLFYNPPLSMLDVGFRDADQVSLRFGSTLLSNELNYRRWTAGFTGLDLLFGVRYLRQSDVLGIATQRAIPVDAFLAAAQFGPSVAASIANINSSMYQTTTFNNIVAPQIGAEYTLPVFRWLSLSGMGKAAWGANFVGTDVSLTRAQRFTAFDTRRTGTSFGEIYELGGFADVHMGQKMKLRFGYTSTWLLGLATANDQVQNNLMGLQGRQAFPGSGVNSLLNAQQSIPHGFFNTNGSTVYFGPQIELQVFF